MTILGIKLWRGIYPQWYYDLHHEKLYLRKLKFIERWHSIFPGKYCWGDCVAWAISPSRWNPFNIENTKACEAESNDPQCNNMCYCGGWFNGVCFDKLPKAEQKRIEDERKGEYELHKDELPF